MTTQPTSPDVALVTGGARGAGLAIAHRLAAAGVSVALLDAPPTPPTTVAYELSTGGDLDRAVAELSAAGARVIGVPVDVRSRSDVDAAVGVAEEALGPITRVVVASGLSGWTDAAAMTDAEWDDVIDTNLHGFFNVARRTLPAMTSRGHGRVVVVVGDEGRRGVAGQSHIAAASWSVIGLAKSIALESAASGVAVNMICAGPSEGVIASSSAFAGQFDGTAIEALASKHPNGRPWVEMSDIADAAVFLLNAPGTAMTGSVLDISNGMSALNSA